VSERLALSSPGAERTLGCCQIANALTERISYTSPCACEVGFSESSPEVFADPFCGNYDGSFGSLDRQLLFSESPTNYPE
jgi:hypothetical protein